MAALAALDLVADVDADTRIEASIRLGVALVLVGDREGRTMLKRQPEPPTSGNPIALARAVCSMEPLPGASTTTGLPDRPFRSLAEAALDTLPPSEGAWRTRVLALLGSQLAATDDPGAGKRDGPRGPACRPPAR